MDLAVEVALAGYSVGWFAPEYKYLYDVWRDLIKMLEPYTARSNVTEMRIDLVTGGWVDMWSLDGGNAGRGRKYARVIIDEAAMVPNLLSVWYDAIRFTLADLKGDAFFLSTPNGRNNFWQLWQLGQDPQNEEWMSWQFPTITNPFISPAEIEAARLGMPEDKFRQESLAEFLESSSVFTKIQEAATAKHQGYAHDGYPSHPKHTYVVGVDWGKYEDFSVFAVVDTTTKELCYLDRSRHIEYTDQVARLKDICQRYEVNQVIAESNSQATTMVLIRHAGLPLREFAMTNASKQNIIDALKLALQASKLRILPDPVLIGELQAFEATRTPENRIKYAAPPGYHDDCVMALALAWDAAKDNLPVRVEKRRSR
jgi:hypothetical protein